MSGRHRGWGRHLPRLAWVALPLMPVLVLAFEGGVRTIAATVSATFSAATSIANNSLAALNPFPSHATFFRRLRPG